MATASIQGFKARLYVATSQGAPLSKVGELMDVTLNIAEGAMDATSKDSQGWKEHLVGLREWGLTGTALYLGESTDAGQFGVLWSEVAAGSNVFINLYEWSTVANAPTSGAQVWSGAAVVTTFDIGSPLDKPADLKIAMKGTGALSKAAATSQ